LSPNDFNVGKKAKYLKVELCFEGDVWTKDPNAWYWINLSQSCDYWFLFLAILMI